jgi:hypothetical protein
MKLFEVMFLVESDDLFTNKEHDATTATLQLDSINHELDSIAKDTPRYNRLLQRRLQLLALIRPVEYTDALNPGIKTYNYARSLGCRWPEGEAVLLHNGDTESLFAYAEDIVKGRWPEAEPIIIKDPEYAYLYARSVIKGRWPEAEPTIMKNPEFAYFYAKDVIKGRWPKAEPIIMTSIRWIEPYARSVIKGRWPKAEPIIKTDASYWKKYQDSLDELTR